jgi:hypothetical protein
MVGEITVIPISTAMIKILVAACQPHHYRKEDCLMRMGIEIRAGELTLADILDRLDPAASNWVWVISEIQGVGDVSSIWAAGIVDLEQQSIEHPQGIQFTWPQIKILARQLTDLWDLTLAAYPPAAVVPEYDRLKQSDYQLLIELCDSSSWHIYTEDKALLHSLLDLPKPMVAA